ncbi:hypothetical protein [Saccharicrinis sp. 156]|uniref:hypothetical protein n=1 Tax=Saccharicrinis sp. 156 TaxID=3417574 RepID=UPI003D330899
MEKQFSQHQSLNPDYVLEVCHEHGKYNKTRHYPNEASLSRLLSGASFWWVEVMQRSVLF